MGGGKIAMAKDPVVGVTLSFPWVNNYKYVDYEYKTVRKKSGFFGLGIGAYYKRNDYKISFNIGLTEDLDSPIGAIDYSRPNTRSNISSQFAELVCHYPFYKSLNAILGLNYTSYKYEFTSFEDRFFWYKKTDHTLGFSAGVEYRFNKYISAAAIYRPAFASFETDGIYRHVISLDIRIDITAK